MKGLTMDEKPNVGCPYTSRNCNDVFLPIPIAVLAGPMSKFLPWEDSSITRNAEDNVHVEHDQEGSDSNG